jgi:ABC-type glycerol-3-phosphate transport system substrate-binding protein
MNIKKVTKGMISIFMAFLLIPLTGCSGSDNKAVYDKVKSQIQQVDYSDLFSEESENETASEAQQSNSKFNGNISVSTYYDPAMESLAEDFMKLYPGVHITVNQHYEAGADVEASYQDYISYTVTSLMGASADDLIDISGLPRYKLAASGVLTDLFQLIENDAEFHKDEYYWNVIEALTYEDKLFYMPTGFYYDTIRLNTVALQKAGLSEKDLEKADYENIIGLYNQTVKAGNYDNSYFLPFKNAYKDAFDKYEMNIYIEYEKKAADFENEDFTKYAKLCKAMPSEEHAFGQGYSYNNTAGGFPKDYSYIRDQYFADIFYPWQDALSEMLPFPNMITSRPRPVVRSDGGHPFDFINAYSISQSSENKELVWEFLKYCISKKNYSNDEMYNHINEYMLIPINRDNFKFYFDFLASQYITQMKSIVPDATIEEETFQKEAFETFDQWNKELDCPMAINSDLDSIISDIMEQYFYNDASVSETADQLQKRVNMYFQE